MPSPPTLPLDLAIFFYSLKLGLIFIFLPRMPSSSLPSLPTEHICDRVERYQTFFSQNRLRFKSWPCYLLCVLAMSLFFLKWVFIHKMRTLLFHGIILRMKFPVYLTDAHFLWEAFFPRHSLHWAARPVYYHKDETLKTSIWFAHSVSGLTNSIFTVSWTRGLRVTVIIVCSTHFAT